MDVLVSLCSRGRPFRLYRHTLVELYTHVIYPSLFISRLCGSVQSGGGSRERSKSPSIVCIRHGPSVTNNKENLDRKSVV